jgi:hypothetical protein
MLGAGGAALDICGERRRRPVKNWWRKWSDEIPLAFGDALWEVLVVQFADFLSRLTLRRVLEFVAIAILVMAFAQMAPIELAFMFAGDTLMYLEFVVMIRLVAGREHLQAMLRLTARLALLAMRLSRMALDISISRINRLRERRCSPRATRPRIFDRSDDGEGPGVTWAWLGDRVVTALGPPAVTVYSFAIPAGAINNRALSPWRSYHALAHRPAIGIDR